jgi:peptidoglycan hydrolase CwlO-like protein
MSLTSSLSILSKTLSDVQSCITEANSEIEKAWKLEDDGDVEDELQELNSELENLYDQIDDIQVRMQAFIPEKAK